MRIGIYPGSFDPVTKGHLNIIERASRLFDKLIIVILNNTQKKQPLLTLSERQILLQETTRHLENVEVDRYEGLLVDYAALKEAACIIRGIRSYSDLEMEQTLAHINHRLNSNIETIFLMTDEHYRVVSSSAVRELIQFHGDYKWMVPEVVFNKLKRLEEEKDGYREL